MIITNKYNIDDLVVKAVTSDYEYKDGRYSVTSILTDYKDIILKRRHHHEIVRDVSEMAWLMFGTAFHEYMEKQEDEFVKVSKNVYDIFKHIALEKKEIHTPNENGDTDVEYFIKPKLKEAHLTYKCERSNYILTGYSDLYNILTNVVTDYKTASVNKVLYNDWDDYIKQLKQYAVMLNSMGFPCNKGHLLVFLKDWSATKFKANPKTYPSSPIYPISFEFTYQELQDEKEWIEQYFMKLSTVEQLEDDSIVECEESVRKFGRKPTYALMKNKNKTATKLFDTEAEAYEYIRYNKLDLDTKNTYYVKERKAEDVRCMEYCDSCHWCHHFINNYAKFVLLDETGKAMVGFKNREELDAYLTHIEDYRKYEIKEIVREEVKENE